jgi:hypothetical protein
MRVHRSVLVLVCVGALLGMGLPPASARILSSHPATSVSFNGTVTAMVTRGSTVYVVGAFTAAEDAEGTHPRQHLAAVDLVTGRLLPWHSRTNGTPLAVSRYGKQLFVGGDFTKAGKVPVSGLARISAVTGRVSRTFRPRIDAEISALATTKRAVFIGGDFRHVDGDRRSRLAAVARTSGSVLPWRPQANSKVWTLRLHGGSVYAGGDFTTIHGKRHPHLVRLRTTGAGAVVPSFHPRERFPVHDVAFAPRIVAAAEAGSGGRVTVFGPHGKIQWRQTFDGDVQTLVIIKGDIYVGGHWINICSTPRVKPGNGDCLADKTFQPRLAAYTLDGRLTGWAPHPDSGEGVTAMAKGRNRLAVGGAFDHFLAGTVTQPRFALFTP